MFPSVDSVKLTRTTSSGRIQLGDERPPPQRLPLLSVPSLKTASPVSAPLTASLQNVSELPTIYHLFPMAIIVDPLTSSLTTARSLLALETPSSARHLATQTVSMSKVSMLNSFERFGRRYLEYAALNTHVAQRTQDQPPRPRVRIPLKHTTHQISLAHVLSTDRI